MSHEKRHFSSRVLQRKSSLSCCCWKSVCLDADSRSHCSISNPQRIVVWTGKRDQTKSIIHWIKHNSLLIEFSSPHTVAPYDFDSTHFAFRRRHEKHSNACLCLLRLKLSNRREIFCGDKRLGGALGGIEDISCLWWWSWWSHGLFGRHGPGSEWYDSRNHARVHERRGVGPQRS